MSSAMMIIGYLASSTLCLAFVLGGIAADKGYRDTFDSPAELMLTVVIGVYLGLPVAILLLLVGAAFNFLKRILNALP